MVITEVQQTSAAAPRMVISAPETPFKPVRILPRLTYKIRFQILALANMRRLLQSTYECIGIIQS
jgi:hypothetical protein